MFRILLRLPFSVNLLHSKSFETAEAATEFLKSAEFLNGFEVVEESLLPDDSISVPLVKGTQNNANNLC